MGAEFVKYKQNTCDYSCYIIEEKGQQEGRRDPQTLRLLSPIGKILNMPVFKK